MDPQIIIFAIESAVKIGRKVYEVLVDATAERALILPVGNLFADVKQNIATDFFLRDENFHFIGPGGPYENFSPADQLKAYKTLLHINERIDAPPDNFDQASDIIGKLHAFEQLTDEFKSKPAALRVLGTLIEIGVDYFSSHPEALGADSNARRVLQGFIGGLTDIDFADASLAEITGDLVRAALKTFEQNVALLDDDKRIQVLLGGVAKSLAEDFGSVNSAGEKLSRKQLFARLGSSILRGGATAFDENIDVFLPKDAANAAKLKDVVKSTLDQVLSGIGGQENLFTSQTFELVFRSALTAVGENPDLLTKNDLLQKFISGTVTALTDTQGRKLFSDQTVAVIVQKGLEVVRDNVETLIDPKNPQQQFLSSAIAGVARSLASSLSGSGNIKDLLSSRQIVDLTQIVFTEVAKHPEQLLGGALDDDKKTALTQIISSVASALGDDPTRLTNGSSFIELVKETLKVAVTNADQLLNLDSTNPATNPLFKAIQQVSLAVLAGDGRRIVTRDVFVDIVSKVLPVVSANLDPLLANQRPVFQTVEAVLALAGDTLKTRLNGANLPGVVQRILALVLSGELKLSETNALAQAVTNILKII